MLMAARPVRGVVLFLVVRLSSLVVAVGRLFMVGVRLVLLACLSLLAWLGVRVLCVLLRPGALLLTIGIGSVRASLLLPRNALSRLGVATVGRPLLALLLAGILGVGIQLVGTGVVGAALRATVLGAVVVRAAVLRVGVLRSAILRAAVSASVLLTLLVS